MMINLSITKILLFIKIVKNCHFQPAYIVTFVLSEKMSVQKIHLIKLLQFRTKMGGVN